MSKETDEKKVQDSLWEGDDKAEKEEEEESNEEEGSKIDKLIKDGEPPKEEEEEEGKGKKEETKQELETVEDEKNPALALKAKVREREQEAAEHERRMQEAEEAVYKDEDFEKSMNLEFSKNKIDVDGEKKSLRDIAKEYPDVAALIKDLVGQAKKELGAPLKSAQEFIEDTRFWQVVEAKHPAARTMSSDKEFMAWIEGDKDLQTLTSTGNPQDIVFVLDTWKAKNTPKVDKAKEAKKNILKKTQGSSGGNRPVQDDGEDSEPTPDMMKSLWG